MNNVLYSLGLGLAGGAVGNFFDIPLGWLLGAILANMVASMHSLPVAIPRSFRQASLIVIGVMIGSAFSPQLLEHAHQWGFSLAGMILLLAIAIPWGYFYGRRITKFDKTSALFASIPGGLGEMVMLGWSMGANPRTTTLAQSARLLTIVVLVPFMLRLFADLEVDPTTATVSEAANPWRFRDAVLLALAAIAGGFVARFVHAPAPFMVGPMLVTAGVYMSGLSDSRLPLELIAITQVVLGSSIGTTFSGASLRELIRTFSLSIGLTLSLLVLVVLFAFGVSNVTDLGFAALILAFTPGGLAEMAILSLLLDVDPVFVATHQTTRVVLIYLLVPIVARRWLAARAADSADQV
ncbi:MAG: AbrB family transcriptional regulator [Gammaproteobacteria bacterium]|nr:AbrB family transcriptional regulator [Gammaproteobacteria bacterium]